MSVSWSAGGLAVVWSAMPDADESKKWTKHATERVVGALNRADEIGGEVRDFIQDRMQTDPRYVKARKMFAKIVGKTYESRAEANAKAAAAEAQRKATAAPTAPGKAQQAAARKGYG